MPDEILKWTEVVTPELGLPELGRESDFDSADFEPVETIVLRRRAHLHAESDALILIEIHRDLLGAFVVSQSTASTDRAPRSVAVACSSCEDAMVEAGSRIHRALSNGYRLYKETAFSSRL